MSTSPLTSALSLESRYMDRRKILGSALVGIVFMCAGLVGCGKEDRHVLVMMASGLQSVNDYWVRQGQPIEFNPMQVVHSTSEQYYSYTNQVICADITNRCRFAVRSRRIHTPGIMVITEKGAFLWIYDSDGRVVISPEKNGINGRTEL